MEGAAGCGGEIGDDRGDDASGSAGHQEHGVPVRLATDVMLGLALHERDRPAQIVGVPDLDRSRVERGLVEQRLRDDGRVGLILGAEVDGLDDGVRALATERLGEPGDRATEDAESSRPAS